ncbi:MAG: hypothetical protein H0T84_14475 [Tatlockia sp.]|nr:hypothetical protein [Tatlockia sp.]
MTYIYVPFKKNEVPPRLRDSIEQWVQSTKDKNKEVVVSYSGEKGLANLPENTKIYVLVHGKAGKISSFVKRSNISSQIARSQPSLSAHLRLADGKYSKLVPDIADEMIEDKLFTNPKDSKLHIKLFFFNAGQQAPQLAQAFNDALKDNKNVDYSNRTVRVDYYTGPLRPQDKLKIFKPSSVRHTLLNSDDKCNPGFSQEQLDLALEQYREYKSSRVCGLSGILGLNGFFSSDASLRTIEQLRDNTISDEQRFSIAKMFVARNSEKYFAECLNPYLQMSTDLKDLHRDYSVTGSVN